MTIQALFVALALFVCHHEETSAYIPLSAKKHVKPAIEFQKAAVNAFAAMTFVSSALTQVVPPADATGFPAIYSSSQTVAEKVIREGIYGEYEVDLPEQVYDDARSTFKSAKETKSNKGKYTALLAVLIVGSFVIPMAQYFWYVKDDDSSDKFFGSQVPDPEPPKKKKGWF